MIPGSPDADRTCRHRHRDPGGRTEARHSDDGGAQADSSAGESIWSGIEGASGAYFAALIQKLGIADTLKPKFQLKTSGEAIAQAVANGEAELGVAPATEIIPVKGAEVLGTFPTEIQDYVVLIGGIGNSARNPAPAKELLTYVTAPAADAVVKKTGIKRNSRRSTMVAIPCPTPMHIVARP